MKATSYLAAYSARRIRPGSFLPRARIRSRPAAPYDFGRVPQVRHRSRVVRLRTNTMRTMNNTSYSNPINENPDSFTALFNTHKKPTTS